MQLWLKQLRTKPGDSIYDSKQKEGAARASVTWCNDFHRQDTYGDRNSLSSACFDVDQCAAAADAAAAAAAPNSTPPKYALLLTNTLQHEPKSHRFRPEHFWSFTAWQARGVDTVLFIPRCPESATYVICGLPACLLDAGECSVGNSQASSLLLVTGLSPMATLSPVYTSHVMYREREREREF